MQFARGVRRIVPRGTPPPAQIAISASEPNFPEWEFIANDFPISWAGFDPGGIAFLMARYPIRVYEITGRSEVAEGSPAEAWPVKIIEGQTVADGTMLTQTPFDANASTTMNQVLPLVTIPSSLYLNIGDCLALSTSGSWINNVGIIQFVLVAV